MNETDLIKTIITKHNSTSFGVSALIEPAGIDKQLTAEFAILILILLLFCVLVLIFGLCGNILTLITIICTQLYQNYINKYILVLLTSDSLFIFWLFCTMTPLIRLNFWTCLIAEYIATGAVCSSSNVIVLLTLERFFAVFYPLKHMQYQHVNRWWVIFLSLLPMQFWAFTYQLLPYSNHLLYNKFFGTMYNSNQTEMICYQKNNFVLEYMNIPFYIAAFFLPMTVVTTVNIAIAFKLRQEAVAIHTEGGGANSARHSARPTNANDKILFVIPAVYAVLAVPLFSFAPLIEFFHLDKLASPLRMALAIVSVLPYYFFNFTYNWLVYAIASKTFRREFITFWSNKWKKRSMAGSTVGNKSNSSAAGGATNATKITEL